MGHAKKGHHSCCNKQKVRRGLWSPEEDEKLINYISTYGHGCWSSVPSRAGLQRCGKSCRLRWVNYLRPDLKRGSFSPLEETLIIELHRLLGNRWAKIAKHLPGRTDNEVKNFWNSTIKKKLICDAVEEGLPPPCHLNNFPMENSLLSHYSCGSIWPLGYQNLQQANQNHDSNMQCNENNLLSSLIPSSENITHGYNSLMDYMGVLNGPASVTEVPSCSNYFFPPICSGNV